MKKLVNTGVLCPAVAAVLAAASSVSERAAAGEADTGARAGHGPESTSSGQYLAGDFHNHTTCSDGSTSVRTLTRQSLARLDWFIQVGHSGSGPRDCRVDDFLYFASASEFSPGLWINTLSDPATEIKGDFVDTAQENGARVQEMWKWQMLQEFALPSIITEREAPGNEQKEALLGLEWTVPGHEHTSSAVVTGQHDAADPNADAQAQFEYCFGQPSEDTSGGGGQGWTCEISAANNQKLMSLFQGRPEEGIADYNSTLLAQGGVNTNDDGQHVKSAAAVLWTQEKFPGDGFTVQAHVERQGAFIPGQNRGFNVEHMRDWNSLAPEVAFGFESQPGHQAVPDRGSYAANRPTSGLYTFGGTGCYGAAEAAKPGLDFDGRPLDPARFLADGDLAGIADGTDPRRVTLCRPGVRTMWDALLSEGRHFFFFASSDWHNRGSFGPLDFETDGDFWPGEYQQNYTWIEKVAGRDPGQRVVDGLRSGNSFSVQGQLIDALSFKACSGGTCASMGQTLTVRRGAKVSVQLTIHDPSGPNRSAYEFDNPSLLLIGENQPLNQPEVAQVDLIQGVITGIIPPHRADGSPNPAYYDPVAPAATRLVRSWNKREATHNMEYEFDATHSSYVRARGSNLPAGTPNERDADGNPLPDNLSSNIACADPACPPHVAGILDADVEAWADIWFYTNPIFIDVRNRGR